MVYKSLVYFKLLISTFFIFLAMFLIVNGFISLKNNLAFNDNTGKIDIRVNKKDTNQNISVKQENEVVQKKLISKKNNSNTAKILKEKIIIVKKNDTFSKIIDPFFKINIKNLIINKLNKKFDFEYLKIGQKIFFYENQDENIIKIIIPKTLETELIIDIENDKISLNEEKVEIIKEINSIKFKISSSLYKDGIKANVPLEILADSIKLFSFDIDFQRDIKKNTIFEVSYETLFNTKRDNAEYGKIKYINLIIDNKALEYFIFKTEEGYYDYFNKEGKNVKKSLLKTPIDGARLSSSFGMRKHPISGFNKLHKGVDFAAPTGTPIYAGGNGVIEFVGNNGGYGKYIRIRHNNMYKTAYAHLSGFKKGMHKGKRVNQGDVIGYVGSTGKSTGPHLHYEIIYQNKQVNPMKLKLPSGKVLDGEELKKFNKKSKEIYAKHLFALYE